VYAFSDRQRRRAHPVSGRLGCDVLALEESRPIFVFQCTNLGPPDRVALIADGRKLIVRAPLAEDSQVEYAYDLREDPAEHVDRAAEGWAAEQLRALLGSALAANRPLLGASAPGITARQVSALRALGYLDD
jgi:hypothetical protein